MKRIAFILAMALAPLAMAQKGYRSEEVTVGVPEFGGVRLTGTLTLPDRERAVPAAVLISGAGPQDRDGTFAAHKPFAAIAEYLSSRGIAVLRLDDRGVGGSTGDQATATWLDLAADAEAAVAYLGTRAEIDAHAIGLVGHSQGGIIAPIASARNKDIAFVVSLAGPSIDFIELTLSQRRSLALSQGAPVDRVNRSEAALEKIFATVAGTDTIQAAQEGVRAILTPETLVALGAPESARDMLVSQLVSEQLFIALHYSPQRVLPTIDVPILALTGSLDAVVDADANLASIAAASQHNPDVTAIKLEGLNHFFQTAKTGEPAEYAEIAEAIAPAAVEEVFAWIAKRFIAR